jgi:hypothetical protein
MLESAARAEGERLGPVGGRIVAEVLTGLIDADPTSYRALDPDWSPTLPARGERFGLIDLLVPPPADPAGTAPSGLRPRRQS